MLLVGGRGGGEGGVRLTLSNGKTQELLHLCMHA